MFGYAPKKSPMGSYIKAVPLFLKFENKIYWPANVFSFVFWARSQKSLPITGLRLCCPGRWAIFIQSD
jgi:hypothetical protein